MLKKTRDAADDVNLLAVLFFVVELGFAAGDGHSCHHQTGENNGFEYE